MNCEQILAALNDYVDGVRDTAICKALEEHLTDCNPCRLVVDNIRHTIKLYKAGYEMELPAELNQRLHNMLRERWEAKFAKR
ncbi:MAG: zf-HC2 domain-containing protein [Pirellulales bacterium]|nr:zf-HC2 domain-containing protein [Pirellulales bacterium]